MRRLSLRGLVALGVAVLLAVVRVPGADCNHNGIDDAIDVLPLFALDETLQIPTGDDPVDLVWIPLVERILDDGVAGEVVVLHGAARKLTVLTRDGDTFGVHQEIFLDVTPSGLEVFGFGPDRHVDLIVASAEAHSLFVFENRGGFLAAPVAFPTGAVVPTAVAVGSLVEGTTQLDLAVADATTDTVVVYRHLGGADFEVAAIYDVGEEPRQVLVATFDEDSRADIATLNVGREAGGGVTILFSQSEGFTSRQRVDVAVPGTPSAFAAADIYGDRLLDLVVAHDSIDVLENRGDRSFRLAETAVVGAAVSSLAVADLDRDRDVDVIAALPGSSRIAVFQNQGGGSLGAADFHEVGAGPLAVFVRQFDNDRYPDIAVAARDGGGVSLVRNATQPSPSLDDNRNGIPDECDTHPCDVVAVIIQSTALADPRHVSLTVDDGLLTASRLDEVELRGDPPGEDVGSLTFAVAITTDGLPSGVKAWSLSAGFSGDVVATDITLEGTAAALKTADDPGLGGDGFFHVSHVLSQEEDPVHGVPGGPGIVIATLLAIAEDVSLPPTGAATVALVTVEGTIPGPVFGRLDWGQAVPPALASPPTLDVATVLGRSCPYSSMQNALIVFPGSGEFMRGDANDDGKLDVSDTVFTADHLFRGGPEPSCLEALDGNDDGEVDVSDAIVTLIDLFFPAGSVSVAPPRLECGQDPTPDGLGCRAYRSCP